MNADVLETLKAFICVHLRPSVEKKLLTVNQQNYHVEAGFFYINQHKDHVD